MVTINRVFCYSKEEAKKNKNNVSMGRWLLQIMLTVASWIIISNIHAKVHTEFMDMYGFLIDSSLFLIVAGYFSVKFFIGFLPQLMGFAIDSDNNVYYANKVNNGEVFAIGGVTAKNAINRSLNKSDSFAGDVAEGLGVALSLYSLKQSAKLMQDPEIIAKIVENAETTTGAEVTQILRVHNYTQNLHKVKIKCDYKMAKRNKVKYNKTIIIYKSFNCFDELMNAILNVRGD